MTSNTRGALYMVAAVTFFTLAAAVIKSLSDTLPDTVLVFFRHLVGTLCFLPVVVARGPGLLRTERPVGHFVRSALGFGSYFAFVFAIGRLPFGDAVALSFTAPLWSTVLAVLVLKERVGPSRVVALVAGFGGALLLVKPGGTVGFASLVALVGAFGVSAAMLAVKQLSRTEPPDRIAFYFLAVGTLLGLPFAAIQWVTPVPADWGPVLAVGILSWLGQLCLSRAYALGELSRIAPLDLLRIPMSVLIGLASFGERPDLLGLAGMVIVGVASVYTVAARPKPRSG